MNKLEGKSLVDSMVTLIPFWVKMSYNTTMKPTTSMLVWISDNYGVLTEIAKLAKVSPQFVHMVLRGDRASSEGRVEQLLRERGAPMTDREMKSPTPTAAA